MLLFNCTAFSQSESSNFFMYVIIVKIKRNIVMALIRLNRVEENEGGRRGVDMGEQE